MTPARLVAVVVLLAPLVAHARCGDAPGDAQAVADARLQVERDCPCATAATHGAHVRCAAAVAKDRVDRGLLPRQCKSAVKRCAARSTCGKPGYVTCCRVRNGETKCSTARDAARCEARGGTPGACPSCCDACTGSCPDAHACGAVEGYPLCYGECPPERPVCVQTGSSCQCITGSTPCGDTRAPECDGACPPGEMCVTGGIDCGCIPVDSTPCTASGAPACGGECGNGVTCTFLSIPDFVGCLCPAAAGCGTYPTCGAPCPPPKVCRSYDYPGLQACVCQAP
jgi:hypothetical protein